MALAPGTKVGVYEVVATLGRGGMGEVYRARDSKLHRDVALKVLPDSFATDSDRLARFQREARVLASLNHPHIASIYGLEETGTTPALILELVEGPTLADRIALGPIALRESIAIARQVVAALDAAHEQGIVHRDLKPANIKVKDDGTVKVLDFGLAKALDSDDAVTSPDDLTQSPAMTSPVMTRAGVLLGTAGYMSPEAARGRPADKRADIWAFGCVVFEMLAGKPAFGGESTADLLGAILHVEPDWAALPGTVPPAVVSVLQRCLQKDRKLRARDIADVQSRLDDALDGPVLSKAAPRASSRGRGGLAGWIAAAAVTLVAGAIVIWREQSPAQLPETRFEITTPPTRSQYSLAVAPDGRSIVFSSIDGDQSRLWLRPLQSDTSRPLIGTESGIQPFWSHDGQSIGFFANGQLKRFDLATGAVRTLAAAPQPRRGVWNRDGVIVFGAGSTGTLFRVGSDGGTVSPATTLLKGQTSHRFPQLLPDGREFLFMTLGLTDGRGLYRASLDDPTPRRVMDRDAAFALLLPDHVLVARQGGLWARRFNPGDEAPSGEFMLVAQKVLVDYSSTGNGVFAASPAGTIAYRTSAGNRQLVWLDPNGASAGDVGEPNDHQQALGFLSRDGRSLAITRYVDLNSDVWLVDPSRGTSQRLTTDPGVDGEPVLSRDGSQIVYGMDARDDVFQIVRRKADGTDNPEVLYESSQNKNPVDWSTDGRYILFMNQAAETGWDLHALPLVGERKPIDIARTQFAEVDGRFSPDGKWVAFASEESGREEIYVQSFPTGAGKQMVSVGGGSVPRWRRDGRAIFYLVPNSDRLMTVSMTPVGASLAIGTPGYLFTLPAHAGGFEPSPEGQKFLVNKIVSNPSPISVILNWKPPVK